MRDAEASGNPHQPAFAYLGQLVVAAGDRDVEQARRAYARARRWSDTAGNRRVYLAAPLSLAMAAPEDQPLEALYWSVTFSLRTTRHFRSISISLSATSSCRSCGSAMTERPLSSSAP